MHNYLIRLHPLWVYIRIEIFEALYRYGYKWGPHILHVQQLVCVCIPYTHPVKQWAALISHRVEISDPPHTCCVSQRKLTCHGQDSMVVSVPPTIRSSPTTSPQSTHTQCCLTLWIQKPTSKISHTHSYLSKTAILPSQRCTDL